MVVFMLSMIFAFLLITTATVVATIFALCFVQWLLGVGQVPARADTFVDEEAPALSRHLVIG